MREPMERSTLPSPADWGEFINASNSKVERDLAQLTLSDPEQRELYEAARLVQTAFRKYKVQATSPAFRCNVLYVLQPTLTGIIFSSIWRDVEELIWFHVWSCECKVLM